MGLPRPVCPSSERVESIDAAEDRDRFKQILQDLDLRQPDNGIAHSLEQAREIADEIGYPVLVRPSFVLGVEAWKSASTRTPLQLHEDRGGCLGTEKRAGPHRPLPLGAVEVDVDVVADFTPNQATSSGQLTLSADDPKAVVCGVMEHIEQAGVHSGDSACTLPPSSLRSGMRERSARRLESWRPSAGPWTDEHPDGNQGRGNLRARGQSTGISHGSIRCQGHWPPLVQNRGSSHDGRSLDSLEVEEAFDHEFTGQGTRVPLREVRGSMSCWVRRCDPPARSWGLTGPPPWHWPSQRWRPVSISDFRSGLPECQGFRQIHLYRGGQVPRVDGIHRLYDHGHSQMLDTQCRNRVDRKISEEVRPISSISWPMVRSISSSTRRLALGPIYDEGGLRAWQCSIGCR